MASLDWFYLRIRTARHSICSRSSTMKDGCCSSHVMPHDLSRRHVDRRDSCFPRHYFTLSHHRGSRIFLVVNICRCLVRSKPFVELLRSTSKTREWQTNSLPLLQNCVCEKSIKTTETLRFRIQCSVVSPWTFSSAQFSKRSLQQSSSTIFLFL